MDHELFDSVLAYVRMLKARGQQYVRLAPDTWSSLLAMAAAGAGGALPKRRVVKKARPQNGVPASAPPVPEAVTIKPAESVSHFPEQSTASFAGKNMEASMADLRSRALVCTRCPHLAASRTQVVFGVGDVHSPLMFVGEAPGMDEDRQGEPFVGRAGQLLTKIIEAMGFTRDKVYIANVLKCRPDTPGQAYGNRKPTREEMNHCLPYLLEQIHLIKPKVIVALGATAVEGLLGKVEGITKLRGHFLDFRGTPMMPTFHPSYLLRNQTLAVKRQVWEDMLQVLEKLEHPISDKQRNYFLKAAK